ncbi:nucleoporin Nup186/Nup192/Nup205 [Pisolithus thermaeus]|nr:nucleoporin Nup186/Nup192/Nup205 [Pisolithus croceorrhizus]KAI6160359.1 nucleoporin Nup186/Nup192/Nup205 [Pisolithus thermaeus]
MESISGLRSVLLTALSSRGHSEQELFDELMFHKSRLQVLFDVGPSSPQEQRALQSGKVTLDGRSLAVNADFAQQTIFLAQQLRCSEKYVASILHSIMAENPNVDSVSAMEATIVEFHKRRRHLVDCLRFLFEAAELAQSSEAPRLYVRLEAFLRQELVSAVKLDGKDVTLANRIFRTIESLGSIVTEACAAKQSATSNTVPPSTTAQPKLGYDILSARCDSLKHERRLLSAIYYQIARLGYFSSADVQKAIDWLSNNPNDSITFYILTAVLTIFDPADPQTYAGRIRRSLAVDKSMIQYMKDKLGPTLSWRDSGLKAVVALKWTLFMTEARHRDPSLENQEGFKTEELESRIWDAVQGDAFTYLVAALIQLQRRSHGSLPGLYAHFVQLTPEQEQQRELPADEFQPAVLNAFDVAVRSLIAYASSELRKIKQRQEDVLASARTDRTRMFRSTATSAADAEGQTQPRNDIATLYNFIGILYSTLPPERALQFWGATPKTDGRPLLYIEITELSAGKLPSFLQWAVWSTQVRDVSMVTALYSMLSGLAKGHQCSELAYNFLARGGAEVIPGSSLPAAAGSSHYNAGQVVSWTTIFSLLESWATPAPSVRANQPPQQSLAATFGPFGSQGHVALQPPASQPPPQIVIGPKEVLLAQAFLRLLSTVTFHAVSVRLAIANNAQFRAIPTLVSLIPLGIPLELKGAIFDTLASFCEPGAGSAGVELCKMVWTLMERLEVINVRAGASAGRVGGVMLPPVKGVEVELDEVEAVYKLYPATIPFLNLLSTLLHTPKRLTPKALLTDAEPLNTIPDNLGQPYRVPGIGPYVSFVVDNVFANIPRREYLHRSERWQMNDLCLKFVERALASWEVESLVRLGEEGVLRRENVVPLLNHPGYDVISRLLTNSPLQGSILSYIVDGVEGFEKDLTEEEPGLRNTIVRVLRIAQRVLEIQDIFLDVLLPILGELDGVPLAASIQPRSYYTRFDQALAYRPQYIPALATYILYPAYSELVLLAVKIIAQLTRTLPVHTMLNLIERSSESERILSGFRQLLEADSLDDVETAEAHAEQVTGAGAPDKETQESLDQAIRSSALNLLVQNTLPDHPYPNIAHFLLFGGSEDGYQIQDPHALGAHRTCSHVILDLVNVGVPPVGGRGRDRERMILAPTDPLFTVLPALAEKCYWIVHNLCVHPRTSDPTMRYLRTREDFFVRHLAAIPSKVPMASVEPLIEVLYNDGARVLTNVPTVRAFMGLRSRILDLAALELHVLTNRGHFKGVLNILQILYGTENLDDDIGAEWEDGMMQPFKEIGQSQLRIIEFVQSLNFDWSDSLAIHPVDVELLASLNLPSCLRLDATGCEIVDRSALLSLLKAASRSLHAQGRITTTALAEKLNSETTYILESCAVENHRREITCAVASGYESWRRLLDMTLMKCFNRLPHDRRENMLFDLLHVLPALIRSDVQERTAILLSEAILTVITKLREDRTYQIMLQSAGGDPKAGSLPEERLYALLRSILECILDNDRSELVRGNLYACLVNYLHLVAGDDRSPHSEPPSDVISRRSMSLSLSVVSTREDLSFSESQSARSNTPTPGGRTAPHVSNLEGGSLSVMKNVTERLVTTICRDAIDGTEVWKTVAFTLLDSLVNLCRAEKSRTLLTTLVRYGYLSSFVRGLKEAEVQLQHVLKPDPDDLNPLYVYEAKMAFFTRMTQFRAGAERLLEAQILPTLAQCEFLDTRPEADQSFMDRDSFLPSAIQRYHQLFMPALQLVVAMLSSLGVKHTTASHQALDFLSNHRDTIIIMLKNDSEEVGLSYVEEVHLLVSLSGSLLPYVSKSELASMNTGFGGIHGAILGLAARCLGNEDWSAFVKPQTDTEVLHASVLAPGQSESRFDATVRHKLLLLRGAIIEYLGAACDFTEPEITLVLSPVLSAPRHDERSSRFVATIPTIGEAIETLNDLCGDLAATLKQIADLSAELSSKDHIRVDNIQEIVHIPDPAFLQDLDMTQKRLLIRQGYARLKTGLQDEVKTALSALEMLLLLLWRHLASYAETDPAHPTAPQPLNLKSSMRLLPAPNRESFKAEAGKRLVGPLTKVSTLDLNAETVGAEWQSYQGYIDIMSRRLRDTIGMHDMLE